MQEDLDTKVQGAPCCHGDKLVHQSAAAECCRHHNWQVDDSSVSTPLLTVLCVNSDTLDMKWEQSPAGHWRVSRLQRAGTDWTVSTVHLDSGHRWERRQRPTVGHISLLCLDSAAMTALIRQELHRHFVISHTPLYWLWGKLWNRDRFNDCLTKHNVFIETVNSTCIAVVKHFNVNLAKQTMFGGILQNYYTDNNFLVIDEGPHLTPSPPIPPEIYKYVSWVSNL